MRPLKIHRRRPRGKAHAENRYAGKTVEYGPWRPKTVLCIVAVAIGLQVQTGEKDRAINFNYKQQAVFRGVRENLPGLSSCGRANGKYGFFFFLYKRLYCLYFVAGNRPFITHWSAICRRRHLPRTATIFFASDLHRKQSIAPYTFGRVETADRPFQ